MQIELLKNAFKPDEAKARTILHKGTIVDVPEDQAQILIDKGLAAEFEAPTKSDTPDESWKVPDLKKYAEEHSIDISSAKNKPQILALILPTLSTPA